MNRRERIAEALTWIGGVLDGLGIPWQVAGGLAARAHGAERELYDIDVYVPEGSLERVLPRVREHRVHGPRRHRDEHWDCYFMELSFAGEEIELAEAGRCRHRRSPDHAWHDADVEFDAPTMREVAGVQVPVMPRGRLLAYKRRLGREVDRRDAEAFEDAAPDDDAG